MRYGSFSSVTICVTFSQARREYLELRQRRRMTEAVQVVERAYISFKVSHEFCTV